MIFLLAMSFLQINVPISPADEKELMLRFDIIEIPKGKTYWMFGARFEKKD